MGRNWSRQLDYLDVRHRCSIRQLRYRITVFKYGRDSWRNFLRLRSHCLAGVRVTELKHPIGVETVRYDPERRMPGNRGIHGFTLYRRHRGLYYEQCSGSERFRG